MTKQRHMTLVGFVRDPFGVKVIEELRLRSILPRVFEDIGEQVSDDKSGLLFPKREWHREAWSRRLDGHEAIFLGALGASLDPQDWMNLLVCMDRVFIDKRPVAETIGYVGALLTFASESVRTLEPGEPVIFLATPHFTRELAVAVAACAAGHPLYVVRPSHGKDRSWISRFNYTQPGPVIEFAGAESFGDQLSHGVSQALLNSQKQNRSSVLGTRGLAAAVHLFVSRGLRFVGLTSLSRKGASAPLRWPQEHYWGYLGHWGMVRVKVAGTLSRWKIKKTLRRQPRQIQLPEPFIYFPLHYQPERTTVPEAGLWRNQLYLAKQLSEFCVNSNTNLSLVVKEHPRQWVGDPRGFLSRSPDFYQALLALPSTILAPRDFDSQTLLSRASVVVTPNGSSAWEALSYGTPSLTTALTWHSQCQASPSLGIHEPLEDALNRLLNMSEGAVAEHFNNFCQSQSFMVPGVFDSQHLSKHADLDLLATGMADAIAALLESDALPRLQISQLSEE